MFGAARLCLSKLNGIGIKSKDMAIITNIPRQIIRQITVAATDTKHMVTFADGKRLEDGLMVVYARHARDAVPL